MENKIFKNLDEQLEIFRSRGLIINNEDNAKEILFRENYFFINGYRHLFMRNSKDKKFIDGTTFEELYGVFRFDRKMRNIMFKYILVIENNIKSIISYQLSKKYGYKENNYLDPKNFTSDPIKTRQVHDVLSKMKRQIRVNGKQHSATMHYINNYGYIPMWVLVKVLSFGIIAELYSIIKNDDQVMLSEHYKLDTETLSIYLSLLANFRNLCAHEDILYDHRTQRMIPNTEVHYKLNIPLKDDEYLYGKNDLYALVIIMSKLLSEAEFREFIYEVGYEIDIVDGIVDTVPLITILNKIGFPDNWREIINL